MPTAAERSRQYVALLRGINVGGKNVIKMADLRSCLEATGLENVATYIQSGNVLFQSDGRDEAKLTSQIEGALSKTFSYDSRVVLRSYDQLKDIVKRAPKGFGDDPAAYRYDVLFLRESLSASKAIKDVKTREGVDQAFVGSNALYFSRLISRATQSYLSRLVALPIYQEMTIRNWNTTIKLLALMEARQP